MSPVPTARVDVEIGVGGEGVNTNFIEVSNMLKLYSNSRAAGTKTKYSKWYAAAQGSSNDLPLFGCSRAEARCMLNYICRNGIPKADPGAAATYQAYMQAPKRVGQRSPNGETLSTPPIDYDW